MQAEVDPNEQWDPRLWSETDDVHRAFEKCARNVLRYKKEDGVGLISEFVELRAEEVGFLELGAASLIEGMVCVPRDTEGPDGLSLEAIWRNQLDAIDILSWSEPTRALTYAAAQQAAHAGLYRSGYDEEKITEAILATFGSTLSAFTTAYEDSQHSLPPGAFLHVCTASMQTHEDELGADLAIVVGTNVLGTGRYRLVLLQAKRATSRCTADVGQGEGAQLDEILSSGMGFYLFYPEPFTTRASDGSGTNNGRMLPTVRSAEAVFSDVWSRDKFSYVVNCYADSNGTVDATDFAEFVALAMTCDDLRIGRLFPDIEGVLSVLRLGGRPLAPRILAINQHGDLSMHELIVRLKEIDPNARDFELPKATDMRMSYERTRRSGPTP